MITRLGVNQILMVTVEVDLVMTYDSINMQLSVLPVFLVVQHILCSTKIILLVSKVAPASLGGDSQNFYYFESDSNEFK